jgi:type II secretory pathway pseudopilin PulG
MHATSPPSAAARPQTAGFSLVEVLIAAFILLIIALGLMPLFTRSIQMNLSGNDSTQLTNLARTHLEEMFQLDFNDPALTVTAGTERLTTEYWSESAKAWQPGAAPSTSDAPWVRTTRVRQFSLSGLVDADEDGEYDLPLPAGSDATTVHGKEIQVRVESNREIGSMLTRPRPITLQVLRSF